MHSEEKEFNFYQHSSKAVDVTQGQGDVDEHNAIAEDHSADVAVALSVDLIFNAPLCTESNGQVGVAEVLHKFDEPEMEAKNPDVNVGAAS